MTQLNSHSAPRRGRIFPERTISPEEKAKRQAELEAFRQRCRPIFERLRPELIKDHYNWFIVIEPESEDYFLDRDRMTALPWLRTKAACSGFSRRSFDARLEACCVYAYRSNAPKF